APGVADLVFEARAAELRVLTAASREPARDGGGLEPRLPSDPAPGSSAGAGGRDRRDALARAARELMALQASDWSFMLDRGLAGDYPLRRIRGHREALDAALAALGDSREPVPPPELRNLAPALDLSPLTAP
ncbi:MAG TPA: 1,4-alpha-glucan branching protein domain-containing protein, partial [Thermoleophilaceae bacterium]|nr:1,4-alpha-glucan branching protein domain-containing protein [Thermoleophilaceae bacterium]